MSLAEDVSRFNGPDAKNTIVTVYSTQNTPDSESSVGPALGRLSIPQSFATPGLCVVRIEVSSMEPQIRKGAYVGIVTTQNHVSSGELFGVRLAYEGLVIKRAYIDMQNKCLVLRSEDASHPEVSLPLEGHESYIVGRAAWVLQRV
jgi:phage repressor protein C with HTH and peptisase S24 domain